MTPSEHWSDEQLLGDTEAPADSFSIFYRRHVEAILRFAATRGLDADAAADVASETFLAALRQRSSYGVQHPTARLWLLGIAHRKTIDGFRRIAGDRRRHEALRERFRISDLDRASYDETLEGTSSGVLDVLGDLPPTQQDAIRQRVVSDRSYADIARDLGLSEPAARQHVSRGLARLRTSLGRNR